MTLEKAIEEHILAVLKLYDGNKTSASRALGIDRRTLYRHLDRIEKRKFTEPSRPPFAHQDDVLHLGAE